MEKSAIELVLANWIAQATSAPGQLPDGVDPAAWVARQFMNWWSSEVEDALSYAEYSIAEVRKELNRLGGWENDQLGEALHELIHARDALADVRARLGLLNAEPGDAEPQS